MYTQCPECLTAFRVTAGLLQQASGRVRCGSCGHAFSAVERLSEDPPPVEDVTHDTPGDNEEAQNALLDTFTDLSAFEDIRIEDTGVEWRVVDEDDADEALAGGEGDGAETGPVRWFIANEDDEQPAARLPEVHDEVPADERLTAEGDDTGILVEESGVSSILEPAPAESRSSRATHGPQEAFDLPHTDAAEPRYDDNTPLPDDLDEAVQGSPEPEAPERRPTDQIEPRPPELDERQVNLELGAPEDWRELLEEFARSGDTRASTPPAELPDAADADLSSDIPSDIDTQFDLKALEMGIGVSGSRPALAGNTAREEVTEPEVGAATGGEPGTPPADPELEADTYSEPAAAPVDLELEADTDPPNADFDPGATGSHAVDFEVRAEDEPAPADNDFNPGEEHPADESDFGFAEAFDDSGTAHDEEKRQEREREAALKAELDAGYAREEEAPALTSTANRETDYAVPPQTEEEMTINMQIDQDLMRLAAEEGFSSTLTGERKVLEDSLRVETIVMEGDFVRTALDKELDEVVEAVGGLDDDPRLLLDNYIKSKERIRGGRRRTDPPSYTVIAGVVVLAVLLMAQVIHAYRESLATYGGFNHTVGSVYRLFGASLTPEWNVRGWRFEATSGSTDQADDVLTIRSRISNQSGGDLPYPLLHVALTDRFEEVIGSRVLEPTDYLGDKQGVMSTVAAGQEFGATITVESVSADATGFKLNVCYREDAARLRCATEDFRN